MDSSWIECGWVEPGLPQTDVIVVEDRPCKSLLAPNPQVCVPPSLCGKLVCQLLPELCPGRPLETVYLLLFVPTCLGRSVVHLLTSLAQTMCARLQCNVQPRSSKCCVHAPVVGASACESCPGCPSLGVQPAHHSMPTSLSASLTRSISCVCRMSVSRSKTPHDRVSFPVYNGHVDGAFR